MSLPSPNAQKPWYQGHGGGATNFTRGEAQKFARRLVESETYREKLQEDLNKRDVAPAIEAMLWYYAYGKPMEQVQLSLAPGQEDLSTLSIPELQKRAADLAKLLEDAEGLANAIDVEATVTKGPWKP